MLPLWHCADGQIGVTDRRGVDGRLVSMRRCAKTRRRERVDLDSFGTTVPAREEVRPMNAVTMWALPLVFTVER
jgi:hypothetical protein